MSDKLKILFVAPEIAPYVKTGGLADVVSSLPKALQAKGHDVRSVMPEYAQIEDKYFKKTEHLMHFETKVGWRQEYTGINYLNQDIPTYFVDNKYLFSRPSLYENGDRYLQFAFFCRSVLKMLKKIDFKPDIIHTHDWQTAPLSLMLDDNYEDKFYADIDTVFTIHNLAYQGKFEEKILYDVLDVDEEYWYYGDIRHDGLINYMKSGIMTADKITTVSKTYADEIKYPYFGEGLDYALRMRNDDLIGIVNGINYREFNPATDNRIYKKYDKNNIEKKFENKLRLQKEFDLKSDKEIPLMGVISRLVSQKGFELLLHIFDELMQEKVQFILLGTGQSEYEDRFLEMGRRYPEKTSINIKYDAELAQKIYAGSDMFLMPSRYEPCGLSQLIALRYGTIPVVRETGGLKDTVARVNEDGSRGFGFSFSNFNAHELLFEIKRGLKMFKNKDIWENIIFKAMSQDYSWQKSADKYLNLYYDLKEK
ncbi:MAG: glycogen synthase GlgA [Bacillota bacterium]